MRRRRRRSAARERQVWTVSLRRIFTGRRVRACKYIHDHLLAAEQGIADEFAGAQGDGLLFVGHSYNRESAVSTSKASVADLYVLCECRQLRCWLYVVVGISRLCVRQELRRLAGTLNLFERLAGQPEVRWCCAILDFLASFEQRRLRERKVTSID